MAKQTITLLTDDIDGTEAAETLAFALDGTNFTIDLSEGNAGKVKEVGDMPASTAKEIAHVAPKSARKVAVEILTRCT